MKKTLMLLGQTFCRKVSVSVLASSSNSRIWKNTTLQVSTCSLVVVVFFFYPWTRVFLSNKRIFKIKCQCRLTFNNTFRVKWDVNGTRLSCETLMVTWSVNNTWNCEMYVKCEVLMVSEAWSVYVKCEWYVKCEMSVNLSVKC